MTAIVDFEQR